MILFGRPMHTHLEVSLEILVVLNFALVAVWAYDVYWSLGQEHELPAFHAFLGAGGSITVVRPLRRTRPAVYRLTGANAHHRAHRNIPTEIANLFRLDQLRVPGELESIDVHQLIITGRLAPSRFNLCGCGWGACLYGRIRQATNLLSNYRLQIREKGS